MNTEENFLERVSSELLPGERILVFGPGRTFCTRPLSTRELVCLVLTLVFFYGIVAAPLFVYSMKFSLSSFGIVIGGFIFWFFLMAVSVPKTSKPTSKPLRRTRELQYFAITNDRFLEVNDCDIRTLTARKNISKIHRKGKVITVFLGNQKTEINHQDIAGKIDFEIPNKKK